MIKSHDQHSWFPLQVTMLCSSPRPTANTTSEELGRPACGLGLSVRQSARRCDTLTVLDTACGHVLRAFCPHWPPCFLVLAATASTAGLSAHPPSGVTAARFTTFPTFPGGDSYFVSSRLTVCNSACGARARVCSSSHPCRLGFDAESQRYYLDRVKCRKKKKKRKPRRHCISYNRLR